MAITTGTGLTQTATSPFPTHPRPAVDFAWVKDEPGEAIERYVAGSLEQPCKIRYAYSEIADIFKGTGVDPVDGQRIDGISILVQLTEVWTDTEGLYLPVSAHFVVRFPVNSEITDDVVGAFITRMLGGLYRDVGDTIITGIAPLMVGVTRLDAITENPP